jgi:outer membrane protein assembly factor BamB
VVPTVSKFFGTLCWVAASAIYALCITFSLSLAAQSARLDWPEYHHDNGRLGVNTNDFFINPTNAAHLVLAWKFDAGGVTITSPAVVNGIVYTSNWGTNQFYALNGRDGSVAWISPFTPGANADSSPAVANGVVYMGTDNTNMYALNAANGNPLWQFSTHSPIGCAPTVANGIVYFGSENNNVYAVGADSGTLIWQYHAGGIMGAPPAIVNGVVYAGSNENHR